MPAGAAGGEQHDRLACHQAVRNSGGSRSKEPDITTRGRSRVSASSMPMP